MLYFKKGGQFMKRFLIKVKKYFQKKKEGRIAQHLWANYM